MGTSLRERRRHRSWPEALKREIVAASLTPGSSVSVVAREGDRIVRDRVRLTWTAPTYGGRRWWFLCPRTARRTTKLFLPNGGSHFGAGKLAALDNAASARTVSVVFSAGRRR
jgi:hypothetical protein